MIYYVDCNGNGDFKTIQEAANVACPGDEVVVRPGIYREQVSPVNGGTEDKRICYRAEKKGSVIVTGAESIKNWVKVEGSVWKTEILNEAFKDYNPYTTNLTGDWLWGDHKEHTGEVYLNHKSLYEVFSLDEVKNPKESPKSWDREFSVYTWYTEQNGDNTVIYANFHEFDPNAEDVEISFRQNCFMPKEEGKGYITVKDFIFREAATQWAPPTAYQDGMIGPHWSKGWIIEGCHLYESKCSGISLGKYLQKNNNNKWSKWKYKDGAQTEREVIMQAVNEGWCKENVGSHIIRDCVIHDCGQTGIVGHLGGVFSTIENNHIYNIVNKGNFNGAEMGGIKMHAAIDVTFRHNVIHHCIRGMWLDWQAQGTRVTDSLFFDNSFPNDLNKVKDPEDCLPALGEDIFVEVSHGPTLIDNNMLLSARSLKLATQGVAVINNLIAGSFTCVGTGTDNGTQKLPSARYTPYHMPHSTAVAGFTTILHGDCRFYNNIFVQQEVPALFKSFQDNCEKGIWPTDWDTHNYICGTKPYDDYPTFETWQTMFEGVNGMVSKVSDRYYEKLPVWTRHNCFFNGAQACKNEKDYFVDDKNKAYIKLAEGNGKIGIESNITKLLPRDLIEKIATEDIPMAFEPEEKFENPDGSPLVIDGTRDYLNNLYIF